jgi:hypothetical protein
MLILKKVHDFIQQMENDPKENEYSLSCFYFYDKAGVIDVHVNMVEQTQKGYIKKLKLLIKLIILY